MAQLDNTKLETLNHVARLVEAFRAFDADNDGLINSAELEGIMGSLGYKPAEQDYIKNKMGLLGTTCDRNEDGTGMLISIEEFLDVSTKGMEVDFLGPFRKAILDCFAGDQVVTVTGEDLCDVFGNVGLDLSVEECRNIIAAMDGGGDGDGAISYEDFKLIVSSL